MNGVARVRAQLPLVLGFAVRLGAGLAVLLWAGGARAYLSINGAFDLGNAGWTLTGGAAVVASGDPNDNPFGRVPDGEASFLYQIIFNTAPALQVTFDCFTGQMSPQFPSPEGFPDTAFVTVNFAASDADFHPELFQIDDSVALLDFDAIMGISGLLGGATVTPSPERTGWTRFRGVLSPKAGLPYVAVTFQTLNANGTPADSAFLVDNLSVLGVPEPRVAGLLAAGSGVAGWLNRRRRWRDGRRATKNTSGEPLGRLE